MRRNNEGAIAVEMAIVVLPFMLAVLGLIALASLFWIWNTLQMATDYGGRYASIYFHPATPPPNWSCSQATQGSKPLENCVEAEVKHFIESYAGYVFVNSVDVKAVCFSGYPTAWGGSGAPVACKEAALSTQPTTMAIRAEVNFGLFQLFNIPLIAATAVPLYSVSAPS